MTKAIARMPPRLKARIAGLMYLVVFIAAPSGAASATPMTMTMTINLASDAGVALMFFWLFRPVNRGLYFFLGSWAR